MSILTQSQTAELLVRYADLVPAESTPGMAGADLLQSRQIAILERARQFGAADGGSDEPETFDVVGVLQSSGDQTVVGSHSAAEIIIAHSGRWRVSMGPHEENGSVNLAPGDVATVPGGWYRRAEMLDAGVGFLFTVRASSSCNDTGAPELVERPNTLNSDGPAESLEYRLSDLHMASETMVADEASPLASCGVEEAGIITPRPIRAGFESVAMASGHVGLNLCRLTLQSTAYIPMHSRAETEVFLQQEGMLEISWDGGAVMIGPGDTFRVPAGLAHAMRNTTSKRTSTFVLRGAEEPARPLFESLPLGG